jgi:hypothetical protein
MNQILVSIEGTICNPQHRSSLHGTPQFYAHSEILKDQVVEGSVPCLQNIASDYDIVYLGKRPPTTLSSTEEWLEKWKFPSGAVHCAEHHAERLSQVRHMISTNDFLAGIGTGWEDNQYHRICACLSIILSGDEESWSVIPAYIREYECTKKIEENQLLLQGKIQGLSHILPRLHAYYGDELWERYYRALMESMEDSREKRKEEELQSLSEQGFDASDLRDIVQWYTLYNEDMYENPNFGLQDWEIVKASKSRCEIKVTRCRYAELWKAHHRPDIGYQLHCRPDEIWLDRPAWNPCVRFEHPKTLMQGDDHCLFIHYLEE